METIGPDGTAKPTGGLLHTFDVPTGPGVRVDTFGYAGYTTNPRYDSLLAKLIVYSPETMADAIRRGQRALREFRIEGLETNIPLLQALLDNADFLNDRVHTTFLEENIGTLLSAVSEQQARKSKESAASDGAKTLQRHEIDPLSVFDRKSAIAVTQGVSAKSSTAAPVGTEALASRSRGR